MSDPMQRRHAVVNVAAKPVFDKGGSASWIGTADVRSSDGSIYYFVVFSEESFPSPEEAKDYAQRMALETFENSGTDLVED